VDDVSDLLPLLFDKSGVDFLWSGNAGCTCTGGPGTAAGGSAGDIDNVPMPLNAEGTLDGPDAEPNADADVDPRRETDAPSLTVCARTYAPSSFPADGDIVPLNDTSRRELFRLNQPLVFFSGLFPVLVLEPFAALL